MLTFIIFALDLLPHMILYQHSIKFILSIKHKLLISLFSKLMYLNPF